MFSLKDILELLDRWPKWKRIQETPDNLDALQKRIDELENRLKRCPGEACPRCGELAFRVFSSVPHHTFGDDLPVRTMKCEKCGFSETKSGTSKSR
jgi:hypothetical protein